MVTICQLCGDKSFSVALIYCYNCRVNAVHRYCLHVMATAYEEYVTWCCEDCDSKVGKPSEVHCGANIPKQSSHVHAESIIEVQCNENADSGRGKPSNIPKHGCYVPAQLVMQPIWNGSLSLSSKKYTTVGGLVAHLSSLACYKVFDEAKLLPGLLCLDLLPRSFVWPKSFEKFGPSDDSIALYLFPNNERDEKVYNSLVNDMISQDLTMRASVKNAELLIFTSQILPFYFWKFQAKFYLWGVFKGK